MAQKIYEISKYALSYTLTNNFIAARMELWTTNAGADKIVATIHFFYEGQTMSKPGFNNDSTYCTFSQSIKSIPLFIDLVRNEKPLLLTIGEPYAYLGTATLEPVGEEESALTLRPIARATPATKIPAKKTVVKKTSKKK